MHRFELLAVSVEADDAVTPMVRAYSLAAGSALSSRTMRRSMSASVTTSFVAVGSKLLHLNGRTAKLVDTIISTAELLSARPLQITEEAPKFMPSPAEPP